MSIDDDTLILHYYDDGLSPDVRRGIDAALRADPALARRYREMTDALAGLRIDDDAAIEPPPAAIHRWQTGLARAARLDTAPSAGGRIQRWWPWIGSAVAAVAVLAMAVSMRSVEPVADSAPFVLAPPTAIGAPVDNDPSASLRRGVQMYLDVASQQLAALPAMDASRQAAVIADLLERNRAYQRVAAEQNVGLLVRALRAFEPALLTLADHRTDAPTFLAEREKLTFELGIVHARLVHTSRT